MHRILILPNIRPHWPDTGKNKFYLNVNFLKSFVFIFSFFLSLNSPVLCLSFLNFLDSKEVVLAHNIYNFLYNATGYPVSGQPSIRYNPDITGCSYIEIKAVFSRIDEWVLKSTEHSSSELRVVGTNVHRVDPFFVHLTIAMHTVFVFIWLSPNEWCLSDWSKTLTSH